MLVSLWACGFAAVVLIRLRSWLRIRTAVRASAPLDIPFPVPVRSSPVLMEPGVVGIFRPVLLCPAEIVDRLAPNQLQAILTHELCHVRRRDNLTAAVHMIVEALFWFHPLVWWISARLVEERERACDESVLESGSDRHVYAESILKTCEFCLESPLACVSGVTGADLKKRMVRIMTQSVAKKLSFYRKVLLAAFGVIAIAGPVVLGLVNAPQIRAQSTPTSRAPLPSFEVASIKPNHSGGPISRLEAPKGRFIVTNTTAKILIAWAYAGISLPLQDNQLSGGPSWISSERYDIDAKLDDSQVEPLEKLPPEQRILQNKLRVQSLLADRFKLVVREETKEIPVYALVIAKNGPKLQETKPGDTHPNGIKGPGGRPEPGTFWTGNGQLEGQALPMATLVIMLSHQLKRTVLDQTGLKGKYDISLKWTPDQSSAGTFMGSADVKPGAESTPLPDSSGPSIFTAIQEQLGLKLESTKGPAESIVIEHIERPSEN